jgi:hypothetical protein
VAEEYRDIANAPPSELWIGKERGRWAIHAFDNEAHLRAFLERENGNHPRRAWKVEGFSLTEIELEPPAPPRGLRVRPNMTEAADA